MAFMHCWIKWKVELSALVQSANVCFLELSTHVIRSHSESLLFGAGGF